MSKPLTRRQALAARNRYAKGESIPDIAEHFMTSAAEIRKFCTGKYAHLYGGKISLPKKPPRIAKQVKISRNDPGRLLRKLGVAEIIAIREARVAKVNVIDLALKYRISKGHVLKISQGKIAPDIGGPVTPVMKVGDSNRKLTPAQIIEMRKSRAAGAKLAQLATDYGISHTHVGLICAGKTHADIGGPITIKFRRTKDGPILKKAEIIEIRRKRAGGATLHSLSEQYQISLTYVSNLCTGRDATNIGGPITPPDRRNVTVQRLIAEPEIIAMREARAGGAKLSELGRRFRISPSYAGDICGGKIHADLGGPITRISRKGRKSPEPPIADLTDYRRRISAGESGTEIARSAGISSNRLYDLIGRS